MLDKRVFLRELGMLAERFGRQVSEPVMLRYYEILNHAISTEDFERAAFQIFRDDQFWPAPARFLDAARGGNPKELAHAEFERLVAACRDGTTDVGFLTPAGHTGMRAAGGWRAIAYAESDAKLAAAKRAFTTAWLDAVIAPAPALTNGALALDIDP